MKRDNPDSTPKDEAVAFAEGQAKRQKPNGGNDYNIKAVSTEKPAGKAESDANKADKIPYQDVLKSKNRHRLPDKIMRCLCDGIEPDVLWWSPHENGFTVDADTVQEKLLDVHFRGTKLSSLVRSLNRWGFRRDFYRTLPKKALAFLHPQFKKGKAHLLRDMKICSSTTQVVDSSSDDEKLVTKKKKNKKKHNKKEESSSSSESGGGKPPAAQPRMQQVAASAPFTAGIHNPSAHSTAGLLAGIQQPQLTPGSLLQPPPQQATAQLLNSQLNSMLQPTTLLQNSLPSQLLTSGNALLQPTLLQVRRAADVNDNRNVTNMLLTNALSRSGLTSGFPSSRAPPISIPNQQLVQQQQQQQQQNQMSAYLQALRGVQQPSLPTPNQQLQELVLASQQPSLPTPNQQLQELVLARQREETLRMLQLNQFQLNNNNGQGQLAASLPLQQQPQQPPAVHQPPVQAQNAPIGDQISAVTREREQMNTSIMAMMEQLQQSGGGRTGEMKTDGPERAAQPF